MTKQETYLVKEWRIQHRKSYVMLHYVMLNDDMECPSPSCRNDDYLKFGDSAVDVDSLPKTNVECLGQTSKINDDPQEEVILRKSTRLQKLPTNKYQDFLMLNEDHKLNNLSE